MSIVKSLSVGDGDMFYIDHNSDNFTIIDCCFSSEENQKAVLDEIREKSKFKNVTRFISTHPDNDHIRGLKTLNETLLGLRNFYCVKNDAVKETETEDFKTYCKLRDGDHHYYLSKGCSRFWMNKENEERGSSGLHCLWPDLDNDNFKEALENASKGESPNNISPIIQYSIKNGCSFLWMGDLESDFQEKIKDKVEWPKVDVLFAPHHGRKSGKIPEDILRRMDPKIIVVGEAPSDQINYYSGYNTITQLSAGNISFHCVHGKIHIFVDDERYCVDFLNNERICNNKGEKYIGTLNL